MIGLFGTFSLGPNIISRFNNNNLRTTNRINEKVRRIDITWENGKELTLLEQIDQIGRFYPINPEYFALKRTKMGSIKN